MEVNKTSVLFGTTYAKETPKCCRTKMGKTMPIGIGASSYNKSMTPVKISSLVLLLDKFLIDKMFFAYSGNGMIALEYGSKLIVTDGKQAKANSASSDEYPILLMADVLWEMEFGKNKEMANLFHEFCRSKLPLDEVKVAEFCDSYYMHNVKANYALRYTESLTVSEVEAAVRSGLFKKAAILSDLSDLQESRFANTKPVSPGVREKKKADKKATKDDFLLNCQKGKYRIKHEWTEEQKELIPDVSFLDDMVTNETFKKFVTKINFRIDRVLKRMHGPYEDDDMSRLKDLGKDFINVSFVGKPGTGKSHNVHAAAAACGLPIYVVNCSHNTDEDRFEGMTKIIDGKPAAIPTEAVKCFRDGGILLLEEVNLAQSAVIMGALGQAVEYPFILKQDGYHDIRRHPLCIVVSTMNVGTAGTKTVAQQFANRFKTSYVMDDPEKDEFIERLVLNTGESRSLCEWIHKCYERITESVREDNVQADVEGILNALSVRTCVGAIENIQEGSSPKEAVMDSIIGKIAEQDAEVASNCKTVLKTIVDYRE